MTFRKIILWGLLGTSVGAAVWITERDNETSTSVESTRKPARRVRAAPSLAGDESANANTVAASTEAAPLELDIAGLTGHFARSDRTFDDSLPHGVEHAFGAKTWYVPPPPPTPTAPEPPKAPPLPFKYLGRYKASETTEATCFIVKNDQTLAVTAGSMIEEIYRVDSISSDKIEFTYLPLEQKQTLSIGSTP